MTVTRFPRCQDPLPSGLQRKRSEVPVVSLCTEIYLVPTVVVENTGGRGHLRNIIERLNKCRGFLLVQA